MGKYISVSEVRSFLQVQDSQFSDTQVSLLINSAESWFDREIYPKILYNHAQVVEYHDGNNEDTIFTSLYPIQSFSKLEVDDDDNGTYDNISSDDYHACTDTGKITMMDDVDVPLFYKYKRNVRMTYTPGVANTPYYIKVMLSKIINNLMNDEPMNENIDLSDLKGQRMTSL